jgi:hypothetical protein
VKDTFAKTYPTNTQKIITQKTGTSLLSGLACVLVTVFNFIAPYFMINFHKRQLIFRFEPKFFKLLLALSLLLLLFEGCQGKTFNHFKIAATTSDGQQIEGAINREKYIIVHNNNDVWHLKNPELNKLTSELIGVKTELPNNHLFYRKVEFARNLNYNRSEGNPENEVHIYITEYSIDDLNQVIIPINSINRLDVYDKRVGKNVLSYVGAFIGGYFALIFIGALFGLLL